MNISFVSIRNLAVGAGMATLALGLTVLVGWHGRIPALIQIHPDFVPMQYNTALGFVLSGVSLLASTALSRKCWSIPGGLTVGLIGLFTLIEHVLDIDLGIDQLFMEHYITVATPHPGRMAPNTALCFTLTGISFFLACFEKLGEKRWNAIGLLSGLMLGFGTVAFSGYAAGIPTAYGWGHLTQMAVHTSLGVIVLGAGLLTMAWREKADHSWLPSAIGMTTATVAIALWQALHAMEQRTVAHVGEQGYSLADEFVLAFGLIMAAALTFATHSTLKACRAAYLAKALHVRLSAEMRERKQDEERLRLAAKVFENSGEAILITDADCQILSVNRIFTAITGYSNAEAVGQTPRLLQSGRQDEAFYRDLWRHLNEEGYWRGELWNRRKNGEIFPVWQAISAVRDAHGGISNYVSLFADITERHRIEQELISARDAAHASAQAKSEFLANMSHEIRTPMHGILGLTQLALNQPLSAKVRDYLEKIHSSSDSLLKILNDILDYSKIEAGLMALENNVFDLDALLDNLHNLFSFHAEEKSLKLAFEVADDVPRLLIGDELRLQQVLANLLGNALKFTEKGSITLSITFKHMAQSKAVLTFSVEDTGIGMSEEVIAQLFQPFTQADGSINRRFGGTGLGLAISRKLLHLLGSEVGVESRPEHGSVFSFDIALSPAPDARQSDGNQRPSPQQTSKQDVRPLAGAAVLVAEDNPVNQLVVCEFLHSAGILTRIANNGREALALIEQEMFDAVLMDVHMPEINGLDVVRRLRQDERFSALPIIALTAGVTTDEREQAIASGMNEFLAKPIDADALLDTLARCIPPRPARRRTETEPPQSYGTGNSLQLPGFDMEYLAGLMGSREAAVNLLLRFRTDAATAMERLEAEIAAGDLAGAERHLHQLKGMAGNVGAQLLHAAAETLDTELKQERCDEHALEALRSAYRAVMEVLGTLQPSDARIVNRSTLPQAFKAAVASIEELLAERYLVPDELLAQLEAATPPERLDFYRQLKRHIDSIDYTGARRALRQLVDVCRSGL